MILAVLLQMARQPAFVTFVFLSLTLLNCCLAADTTESTFDRPSSEASDCQCKFDKHRDETPAKIAKNMAALKPLCGHRFTADDHQLNGYTYNIGICTTADQPPNPTRKTAGATQTHKKTSNDGSVHVLGDIEKAEIMVGHNWFMLEYEGGGEYHTHCKSETKRTIIMVTCKPGDTVGNFRYVEENSNKTSDCYYLFELEHMAACNPDDYTGLSAGSIVCIILVVVSGVYFIGGVLFMRFVRGAKGVHQIPNYSFWRDFGALQADGCNLVCRCGTQQNDTRGKYHGIGDHQIECAAEGEECDDHLLPM